MFVAVLRRQSVTVYRKESNEPVVVNFPVNLVSNLEVKDTKGLAELIAGFLKSAQIPAGDGILLLSEEVCFSKQFTNDINQTTLDGIQSFLGLVPISKANFVSKEFVIDNVKWVSASNRTLCVNIVYGFQEAGLRITMVLPSFVVGNTNQNIFGAADLSKIESEFSKDRDYSMLTNIFAGEKKKWWQLW